MSDIDALRLAMIDAREALDGAIKEACPGVHNPTQHRDRNAAWCPACGRDADGVVRKDVDDPRPQCVACGRRRHDGSDRMDAYDYSPVQVLDGSPVGWYSGDDGELCPGCMRDVLGGGR